MATGKSKAPAVELEVGDRTVRISHPERVYFPATGATKLDLANYYLRVGDGIVRALRERPCMMHRFPDVFGQPVAPTSSSTSCTTPATRCTVSNPHSGIGSRSIRHSSGRSTSARREFHGWNSTVDICTAQITSAGCVTHSSSA